MSSKLKQRFERLALRAAAESGQGLAEYALILGLVAAACVGALSLLGTSIAGSTGFVDIPAAL